MFVQSQVLVAVCYYVAFMNNVPDLPKNMTVGETLDEKLTTFFMLILKPCI